MLVLTLNKGRAAVTIERDIIMSNKLIVFYNDGSSYRFNKVENVDVLRGLDVLSMSKAGPCIDGFIETEVTQEIPLDHLAAYVFRQEVYMSGSFSAKRIVVQAEAFTKKGEDNLRKWLSHK